MTGSGSITDAQCLSFCSKLKAHSVWAFPKPADVGAAVWPQLDPSSDNSSILPVHQLLNTTNRYYKGEMLCL